MAGNLGKDVGSDVIRKLYLFKINMIESVLVCKLVKHLFPVIYLEPSEDCGQHVIAQFTKP